MSSYRKVIPARTKFVLPIEGLSNPWAAIVMWLEHNKPSSKPKEPKYGISVSLALHWCPTSTQLPELEAWRQAAVLTNETAHPQDVTLHFLTGDALNSEGLSVGNPIEYLLD